MMATWSTVVADSVCETGNDAETNDNRNLCQHELGKSRASLASTERLAPRT